MSALDDLLCSICRISLTPERAHGVRLGILCSPCIEATGDFVIALRALDRRDRATLGHMFEIVGQHWAAEKIWSEATWT